MNGEAICEPSLAIKIANSNDCADMDTSQYFLLTFRNAKTSRVIDIIPSTHGAQLGIA